MTDPLDTAAIRARLDRARTFISTASMDGFRDPDHTRRAAYIVVTHDTPKLLAEVDRLRAELAALTEDGEWTTEYGLVANSGEFIPFFSYGDAEVMGVRSKRKPHQQRVWRGPVVPVGEPETTPKENH